MTRFGKRGPILTKGPTGGGSRSNVDVDPVLAVLLGVVIVGGGGLAAFGASQDTEPEPAPAAVVQNDDPVVARALAIVARVDGTVAAGETDTTATLRREAARARRASAKGRSTDPFAAIQSATAVVDGAASGATTGATASAGAGGSSTSAVEQARRAAAQSAAASAATQGATGGAPSSGPPTGGSTLAPPSLGPTPGSPASSSAAAKARARRAAASKPAKISLRVATKSGKSTRNRRSMGLLVPNPTRSVARVVSVSRTNRVVTLRLREGAHLTGKQSKGTMCVERLRSGDCRLVRVRTGRTAVIRAPRTAAGRPGAVTALRVLAVWRGGLKLAD